MESDLDSLRVQMLEIENGPDESSGLSSPVFASIDPFAEFPLISFLLKCSLADPRLLKMCNVTGVRKYRIYYMMLVGLIALHVMGIELIEAAVMVSKNIHGDQNTVITSIIVAFILTMAISQIAFVNGAIRLHESSKSQHLIQTLQSHQHVINRSTFRHSIVVGVLVVIMFASQLYLDVVNWRKTAESISLSVSLMFLFLTVYTASYLFYLLCQCHQHDLHNLVDSIRGGHPIGNTEDFWNRYEVIRSDIAQTEMQWSLFVSCLSISVIGFCLTLLLNQIIIFQQHADQTTQKQKIDNTIHLVISAFQTVPALFFVMSAAVGVNDISDSNLLLELSRCKQFTVAERHAITSLITTSPAHLRVLGVTVTKSVLSKFALALASSLTPLILKLMT